MHAKWLDRYRQISVYAGVLDVRIKSALLVDLEDREMGLDAKIDGK